MTTFFTSLLKICLFLFFSSFLLGLLFLYTGSTAYSACKEVGLFSSGVFTAISIVEVLGSANTRRGTKAIWIASFLVFQIGAGIAYFFVDRKNILNNQTEIA